MGPALCKLCHHPRHWSLLPQLSLGVFNQMIFFSLLTHLRVRVNEQEKVNTERLN